MELDDLKQPWKEADKNQKKQNKNIMELIQHKSYGPLAALKKGFVKQMIVMAIIPFYFILIYINNIQSVLTSLMFWSYVAFCIGVIVFASYNYRITKRMETKDGMVKDNLEKQVTLLETRLKWKIIGLRLALLFFIVLTEVVPYFQHYRMLDKWHSLSPFIRFGSYALLFLFQYFLSPVVLNRKFGRHINYLKELLKEME